MPVREIYVKPKISWSSYEDGPPRIWIRTYPKIQDASLQIHDVDGIRKVDE